MTELEQKIWEACGSPTKRCCLTCGGEYPDCEIKGHTFITEKIDITLSHVMFLLSEKGVSELTIDFHGKYIVIEGCYGNKLKDFSITLLAFKENNEAALLRDQSIETQTAIIGLVNKI